MKKAFMLGTALILSNQVIADASDLHYQYSTPYSGGANLTIINHGTTPATISQVKFTSNAGISGAPWGSLWGWQSVLSSTANPDGMHTDFLVTETPTITLAAGASAVLSYNIDNQNIGGPLAPYNAAMDPVQVSLVLGTDTAATPIAIDGICSGDACQDPGHGKRIVGYYPNWAYWRTPKFTADNIPYDKINTLAYAFAIFDKDGSVSLYDADSDAANLPIVSQARKKRPYLNASLSFGGWSWASTPPNWQCEVGSSPQGPAACFSAMTADSTAMSRFVSNAVAAMKELNFNGIDIDWEYPTSSAADASNYVTLLTQLRQALDAQGKEDSTHYYLSIAGAAASDKIQQISNAQWQAIASVVDDIGVMTYDFHGAFDMGQVGSDFMAAMALDPILDPTYTNPVLSQYNVIDAMNAYVSAGVPKDKLLVGIPVYGRMINIASAGSNQGLYQPITGVPQGEWDNAQSGDTGMLNYNCIVDASTCGNSFKLPALTLVNPDTSELGKYAHTPWAYANNLFVTYDDANSAAYKTQWLLANGFGGAMMWDLSGDFPANDERSIVNVVQQQMQTQVPFRSRA